MLEINDILAPSLESPSSIQGPVRVLAISDDQKTVALIRLDALPIVGPFNRTLSTVDPNNPINGVIRIDSYPTNLAITRTALKKSQNAKLEKSVEAMQSAFQNEYLVFDSEYRGREFKRIAAKYHMCERTVRRLYYLYLWGGMTAIALAGPQRPNNLPRPQQLIGSKKRGRKPKDNQEAGNLPLPQIREKLIEGVKKFSIPGRYSKTEAYILTLNEYFSVGKPVKIIPGQTITIDDIAVPAAQRPTFKQFRYVDEQYRESERIAVKKLQDRYLKPERIVLRGNARKGVSGPGYRYEIDSTKLQIRIVSRLNPKCLVKELTLYIIIDVWSGAIVGYALSLQPPSWFLASRALLNCFTPKTEVFERLNLPYTADDWPSAHLPARLAGDRAELTGNKAGLIPEIGVKLEILSPMRGDRKGMVERKISSVKHDNNFYEISGKHEKAIKRRGDDGKKSAAHTINSIDRLVVEIIFDLNNDPVPVEFLPAQAIVAGISAITYGGLFAWGLKNRAGSAFKLDPTIVITELMVKDIASVTSQGIYYKKYNYTSPELINSGLTAQAVLRGNFDIEIRHDELVGDRIKYLDPMSQSWKDVFNDNADVLRVHAAFWEMEDLRSEGERLHKKATYNNIANKIVKSKIVNAAVRIEIDNNKAARKNASKKQNNQNIAENTKIEIQANHANTVRKIRSPAGSASKNVKGENDVPETSFSEAESITSLAIEYWENNSEPVDE